MISRSFFTRFTGIITAVILFLPVFPAAGASVATILSRQYVTNTVHIAGGNYTTPYIITTPNTEYILDRDISANGTAIAIRASKVVLNLNGNTITYNQTTPGEGVTVDTYNLSDIAITNGSIIQGAALSEGDVYGAGNNPVKTKGVTRLQIAGIHARYGGRDVGGFKLLAYVSIIEDNILEDGWTNGTLKNRMQGVDSIVCATGVGSTCNVIRNNTIINARQRGITAFDQDLVYGNNITINSLATNSYGIFGYKAQNVKVYDNQITARGEHPIGIGFVSAGTNNIEIYNNKIDAQTTRIGDEYGGSAACFNTATPCGNYAVGFRTTWGGNNINFHNNTIMIHTDATYQGSYSPTAQKVLVNGKGRGLMVAVNAGESSKFNNNTITVLDKDGKGQAFGIACTGGNVGNMSFEGNTVTSNILNVALSDEYGDCAGYPLFIKNTFIKVDNYPAYATIGAGLNGYWEGTGRFISNAYQGGAAENKLGMNFQYPNKNKSVIFGRLMKGVGRDASGTLLPNTGINIYSGNNVLQTQATTGADGTAQFMVYDYELKNNSGLTQSATPITAAFRPHVVELHNPANGQTLFKSNPDSSATAWDALTSTGIYTLGDSSYGSVTITTSAGAFVPPAMDTAAPNVAISSPVNASTLSGLVNVSVTANDNVAVTKVELYVNGVLQATDPAPGPYSFSWNSALVTNGSYSLLARAYDAVGNVGESALITIKVNNPLPDTTPPTVSLTAPANNSTVAGKITVVATAADTGGVKRVEFYQDGIMLAVLNTAPYTYSLDTTTLANGSHVLMAKAFDMAGNQSQVFNTVRVNNMVANSITPTVSITAPAPNAVLSGTVTIAAVASNNEEVVKMMFYLNGTLLGTVTKAPYSYNLDTKRYWNYPSCTLTVKAYDAAGNLGQSATITVSVNNYKTLPTAVITSPVNGAAVSAATTVNVSATDNVAVTRVDLYINGKLFAAKTAVPYSFSWPTASYSLGVNTLAA